MSVMRTPWPLALAAALVLAGCGDDSPSAADEGRRGADDGRADVSTQADPEPTARAATGTRIKVGDSEFGTMLFGSNNRATYVFENDSRGKTVCYGECARAWPPVLTSGRPRAGKGVRKSLLGTVKRRNGRRQVTYAGKPLYYYSHEAPGEVRCHNVNLNGGFWWVVGPGGKRRP
jgi:predicted lipoprotein with Yx(FWY)xxD motif